MQNAIFQIRYVLDKSITKVLSKPVSMVVTKCRALAICQFFKLSDLSILWRKITWMPLLHITIKANPFVHELTTCSRIHCKYCRNGNSLRVVFSFNCLYAQIFAMSCCLSVWSQSASSPKMHQITTSNASQIITYHKNLWVL